TLGDGQRWRVPRLMAYDAGHGFAIDLPCYADLDERGEWVNGDVEQQYAGAAKFAERLYDGMIRSQLDEADPLSTAEVLDLSCELLAYNYAISSIEAAMLRLFAVDA